MTIFPLRRLVMGGNRTTLIAGSLPSSMKLRHLHLACLMLSAGLSLHAADAPPTIAGAWALDIARSTPIRPWDKETLAISVNGDTVIITRSLAWGNDRPKGVDNTTVKHEG